eukprot:3463309-Pyramimonas_sp.AAC.1
MVGPSLAASWGPLGALLEPSGGPLPALWHDGPKTVPTLLQVRPRGAHPPPCPAARWRMIVSLSEC